MPLPQWICVQGFFRGGFLDNVKLVDKTMILVDKIFTLVDISSCFVDKVWSLVDKKFSGQNQAFCGHFEFSGHNFDFSGQPFTVDILNLDKTRHFMLIMNLIIKAKLYNK